MYVVCSSKVPYNKYLANVSTSVNITSSVDKYASVIVIFSGISAFVSLNIVFVLYSAMYFYCLRFISTILLSLIA